MALPGAQEAGISQVRSMGPVQYVALVPFVERIRFARSAEVRSRSRSRSRSSVFVYKMIVYKRVRLQTGRLVFTNQCLRTGLFAKYLFTIVFVHVDKQVCLQVFLFTNGLVTNIFVYKKGRYCRGGLHPKCY